MTDTNKAKAGEQPIGEEKLATGVMRDKSYATLNVPATIEEPRERTQHTPGPWKVSEGGLKVLTSDGRFVVADTEAPRFFNVGHTAIQRANARLIAAAPETAAERDRLRKQVRKLASEVKEHFERAFDEGIAAHGHLDESECELLSLANELLKHNEK